VFQAIRNSDKARKRHQEESKLGAVILYGLFLITVILIPLTLVKVYQRWKRANSTPEIVDSPV